ncbi:hypothetical protein DJ529_08730, partial [Sulfolobus sp. C3]
METYQILGIVASILILVSLFIMMTMSFPYYGMMGGRFAMMRGFFFMPFFVAIPSLVLGLIGSLISDKQVGGILLIIASVLSLPVFFGF